MFTGLIQEVGEVVAVCPKMGSQASQTRISVAGHDLLGRLKIGDSIAVSGVCLTAVEIGQNYFSADLAEETLQRTSLGHLRQGSRVNLELPARAADPLGGHVVQGHVDGTGTLLSLEPIQGAEDWRLAVKIPEPLLRYIVPQGSLAIEGISLTVAKLEGMRVEIAIIPHTFRSTNLAGLKTGDLVNIEVDVLARYAEKMVQRKAASTLTVGDLIRRGF